MYHHLTDHLYASALDLFSVFSCWNVGHGPLLFSASAQLLSNAATTHHLPSNLATWPQIFSACLSHLNARRRLRSSTTSALVAPRTVRSTIGDRIISATAASVWNSLPESVRWIKSKMAMMKNFKWPYLCNRLSDLLRVWF